MPYVRRPLYEEQLKRLRNTEDIKVLTGVRRCGKSTLLQWLRDSLLADGIAQENIFYRRMDMFGMPLNPDAQWLSNELAIALESIDENQPFYVLLDEIQCVANWEKVVRQLHTRQSTDVYITGSNAYVLSSDLATLIGGRYIEIKVAPLSFNEFLSFAEAYEVNFDSNDEAFAAYLRFGGMPAIFHLRSFDQLEITQLLKTIYETIILNDVAARTGVSDIDRLSKLVRYVFATSGSLFSTNKIANTLTSFGRKTKPETIDGYLKALVDALILSRCEQAGLAGKEILRPQSKFYPVDNGLRNLMTNFAPGDTGYQLENLIHNELARRGYAVSIGTLRAGEVDFVAEKSQERIYVQATESMVDPKTYQRELTPLETIADSWPKMIVTLDRANCGITQTGIHIVNAIDWLLQ